MKVQPLFPKNYSFRKIYETSGLGRKLLALAKQDITPPELEQVAKSKYFSIPEHSLYKLEDPISRIRYRALQCLIKSGRNQELIEKLLLELFSSNERQTAELNALKGTRSVSTFTTPAPLSYGYKRSLFGAGPNQNAGEPSTTSSRQQTHTPAGTSQENK